MAIKIYGAAKFHNFGVYLPFMLDPREGIEWVMHWPYVAYVLFSKGELDDNTNLQRQEWIQNIKDLQSANCLIAYGEKDDELNGTLVEIGGALSLGLPVALVGDCDRFLSWRAHPLITMANNIEEALDILKKKVYNDNDGGWY